MKVRIIHLIFIACFFILCCKNHHNQPNILLIMADDMGFSDLGFMGSGIETPNLDYLAHNGIVYNQFYNTARCCPSRASLLTGLYAHQTGLGWMTAADLGTPGYTGDLNNKCITMAQAFSQYNYDCYMTGKWHVTHVKYMQKGASNHNWPIQRGFSKFYGHLTGGGSYYSTPTMLWNNEWIDTLPANFYLTSAITDTTLSFLTHHFLDNPKRPFFFYLAYYAPHRPLHALSEDIEKYKGRFMIGWDSIRELKMNVLKKYGIADSSWTFSARDSEITPWDSLSATEKLIWDARMAVYAAQIDHMDQGVGKIIELLKAHNQLNNTIIMFLSDNGGNSEPQGGKLSVEEIEFLGREFPKQSYRKEWANVSNTPFKYYKHFTHEGGIASPLIIHWPKELKSKGTIHPQVCHIIDIFPTLLEVADIQYPASYNGNELIPLQGKSILSSLKGKSFERGPLFFEHEANRAVISGDWKLVSKGVPAPPYTSDWELYDLSKDRSETTNMASDYPELVDSLSLIWDHWAQKCNVYPLDGRDWNDKIKAGH